MSDREQRARDLFLELCPLSEGERSTILARESAGDPALHELVSQMLAADAAPGTFLETPALGASFRLTFSAEQETTRPGSPADEPHPEAIGPYRILGLLGHGGMGIVYRAEQQRPRRIVAIKILRTGLAGSGAQRRFELEAEALGRLKHPGIAQIHEAGTASFGSGPVPFLVMELIEGQDLIAHARERNLSLRGRVSLLLMTCQAVHHAHQNGVIHRDIKPSNVLVTPAGGPKVLDFGLARLVNDEYRQTTTTGDVGQILGTLPYMSPEHLAGDPGLVDVTSDVYSLGATAYELLSGQAPFELQGLSLTAALHRIAHETPPALRDRAPRVDEDLAGVVAKSMAGAKEARYQSAAELAADLERWLNDEPVLARPPGRVEQLRRLVRRHRAAVTGAAAVLGALIAGLVGTTWQARAASRQAERVHGIQTYLQSTLRSAGDPRTDGRELLASHILDLATERLEEAFPDDPGTRAELQDTLGMSYFENGLYAPALDLVGKALEWRSVELGPRSPETLASEHNFGIVLIALGRNPEAEEHLRRAFEARREVLGTEHEDTQRSANWLAQVLLQQADPREAATLLEDSWIIRRRTLGDEALPTLATRGRLAIAWRRLGRVVDAEEAMREILEVERRVCVDSDFQVYETLNNLASLLLEQGGHAEALELLEEAHEGYRRLRGASHPDTRLVESNLKVLHTEAGLAQEPTPAKADEEESRARGLILRIPAANQKFYRGQLAEAEQDLRSIVEGLEEVGGQELYVLAAKQCLASVLVEKGRLEESLELQEAILGAYKQAGTERSQNALAVRVARAEGLRQLGRLDEALQEARQAYADLSQEAGERALYTLSARATLAAVLSDLGQLDEALEHARVALQVAEETLARKKPSQYAEAFRVRYGRTLALLGRREEAQNELLLAWDRLSAFHSTQGPYAQRAGSALLDLYHGWGREDEAGRWRALISGTNQAEGGLVEPKDEDTELARDSHAATHR